MKKAQRAFQRIATLLVCMALLCTTSLADMEGSGSVDPDTSDSPSSEISSSVSAFPDVPADAEYAEAANALCEMGIFTGDAQGNFNPNSTITRAETAVIMCRLMGVEEDAKALKESPFSDVPASHWAVSYIAKATELGIINGDGTGNFRPSDSVTYEQIIKMLVCAWGYGNIAEEKGGYPSGYLTMAEEMGFTEEVSFSPAENALRSGVAQLMHESLELANNGWF